MNRISTKVIIAALLVTILISACKPTPAAIPESAPDLYAGFTGNDEMPFALLHESGENLFVMQDPALATITGGIWNSADGKSIVIYSDENGRPTSAVVGDDIVLYSNYTSDTVDLTVLQADGTSVVFQATLDHELLDKITGYAPPANVLISYSKVDPSRQQQLDKWFWVKTGVYMTSVATCTAGTALAVTSQVVMAPPVLLFLAGACKSAIVGTVTRVGQILDLDVAPLESANNNMSIFECVNGVATGSIEECLDPYISELQESEKIALQKLPTNPDYSGLQQGVIPFETQTETPTPSLSPGIYPIGREYSIGMEGWSIKLDTIEVLNDGTLIVRNLWTNNLTQCVYQGECDLGCAQENDDADAILQLADGTSITPLETNCTNARGQMWSFKPGETFSDWAIYPPLQGEFQPFRITWYSVGSVDKIVLTR